MTQMTRRAFLAQSAAAVTGLAIAPSARPATALQEALDHASASGVVTLFARPQSLDRVWVRFGFIPVPESTLPPDLAGRPGAGLYAWRGGTALWTLREHLRD